MRNSEELGEPSSSLPTSGATGSPSPVLAAVVGGTIILGAIGGWLLTSQTTESSAPVVEMVAPADIPEAVTTLNSVAKQQSDTRACRYPMGFITVSTPGNPAGGTVVFRTSKYQSPPFHVTDKPQRIAIPSPLPETGGVDLSAAISAILFSPQIGFLNWIAGFFTTMTPLRFLGVMVTILARPALAIRRPASETIRRPRGWYRSAPATLTVAGFRPTATPARPDWCRAPPTMHSTTLKP
jgi:hypothetical protein